MNIRLIAFGDTTEAFVEDRLNNGFNIICSDENNKGKTIVIQSALYALGNEPIFPSSFDHLNYYHFVQIELDEGSFLEVCRKGNSFIVKKQKSISILDGVAEFKRYLNRNGLTFPVIIKNSANKIVDPVLLYQLFFVGQDRKDPSTIYNDNYYKKDDFWNLIYSIAGIENQTVDVDNQDNIKTQIESLNEEKKALKAKKTIFKGKKSTALDLISQHRYNESIESKVKKATSLQNRIVDLTKDRNRAISRRLVNERTLNEIRSLNRSDNSGSLYCIECGSDHICYKSGDKSYSFDITDVDMRKKIMESIQDKISAYKDEEQNCNLQINELQRELQALLKEDDLSLETVLMYKDEIVDASEVDTQLVEIDKKIQTLKASLLISKEKSNTGKEKREILSNKIISKMNEFYKAVDPNGNIVFDDLFSKKSNTYSGCEETEFYLSRLYALAVVLQHNYPIMMDYFRDGELSTDKESVVLHLFSELKNQKIFTATLKKEELGKYNNVRIINPIDYSSNEDSHILTSKEVGRFRTLLSSMMVKL